MTHEELLAICDNYSFKDSAEPVKALRAVVELHKPAKNNEDMEEEYPENNGIGCSGCGYDYEYMIWNRTYPCPTIQAIEKELG